MIRDVMETSLLRQNDYSDIERFFVIRRKGFTTEVQIIQRSDRQLNMNIKLNRQPKLRERLFNQGDFIPIAVIVGVSL